jgi:hypothetical protein
VRGNLFGDRKIQNLINRLKRFHNLPVYIYRPVG